MIPSFSWRLFCAAAFAAAFFASLLRPDAALNNLHRAVTVGTAPRRPLFVPAFVSRMEIPDVFLPPPARASGCSIAKQQKSETVAPSHHHPSAGEVVQSLLMQMSRQRHENVRKCSMPYFAADSIIPAYIDSRLVFCDNADRQSAHEMGSTVLGNSQVACFPLDTLAQHDNPTLCEAHSVALQLPLITSSDHKSPWLNMQSGSLLGSCTQHTLPPKVLTHCLKDWFNHAFITNSNVSCDQWIENDTYFVTRHDSLNAWHTLNDMWFAFLSSAVFRMQPHTSLAVFADAQPSGFSSEFWSSAFSASAPLPLLQLVKAKANEGVRTLCFKRAIFNPSATTSSLERALQLVQSDLACSDNLMLQSFATYVRTLTIADDSNDPSTHHSPISVLILKDNDLPSGSHDLFSLLQRSLSKNVSFSVVNVRHTSFKNIISSLYHTSLLLTTSDAAAAFAIYLHPSSKVISLQFDESPLLRMRLVTSWMRISHSSVSVSVGGEDVLRYVEMALSELHNIKT